MTGAAASTGGVGTERGSNRSAGSSCGPGTGSVEKFAAPARLRSAAPRSMLARLQSLRAPALRWKNSGLKNNRLKAWFKTASLSDTSVDASCGGAVSLSGISGFQSLSAAPPLRATKHCRLAQSRLPATGAPCPLSGSGSGSDRLRRRFDRLAWRIGKRRQRRREFRDGLRESLAVVCCQLEKPGAGRGIDIFSGRLMRAAHGARECHHLTHAARERAHQLGRFADALCRRFRAHVGFGNFANGGIEPVAQRRFDRALVQHEGDVQKALDRGGDVGAPASCRRRARLSIRSMAAAISMRSPAASARGGPSPRSVASMRAMALTIAVVSAWRLRSAYSVRKRRPRSVAMSAAWTAS